MPTQPFSLRLSSGKELHFGSQQEALSYFQQLSVSQRLGQVISPQTESVLQAHSGSMRDLVNKLPGYLAESEGYAREAKTYAGLGQAGSVLDGAMSWLDTAAEGAKASPFIPAQLLGRTWLGSTQATKGVMAMVDGKPGDYAENMTGALSQLPGGQYLDKAKKMFSSFNKGYEAGEANAAGDSEERNIKIAQGLAEAIEPDVVGSAVQSTGNTYLKVREFNEMSDLKDTMDKTMAHARRTNEELTARLTGRAEENDAYVALATQGRDPETASILKAFEEQMPDIVRQAKDGDLNGLMDEAARGAKEAAEKAYRKEAPDQLQKFQEQVQTLEQLPAQPPAQPDTPTTKDSQYWFDPDDKDGYVNMVTPDGVYQRMPLEEAIAKGLVPPGTTTDQMTQYQVSEDKFLNDLDTSNRTDSRAERIASTVYPDGMTMPGSGGAGGGRSMDDMESEAEDQAGQADSHADRAEAAARRARAAARRAAAAAARLRAMISRRRR